jgi:hypothetical protein
VISAGRAFSEVSGSRYSRLISIRRSHHEGGSGRSGPPVPTCSFVGTNRASAAPAAGRWSVDPNPVDWFDAKVGRLGTVL